MGTISPLSGVGKRDDNGSQFSPAWVVLFPSTGRLLAHPLQKALQLRRFAQLRRGRVQSRQRFVRECGVNHPVTLATQQTDVVGIATLCARQIMVLRQLRALERALAQAAENGRFVWHVDTTVTQSSVN